MRSFFHSSSRAFKTLALVAFLTVVAAPAFAATIVIVNNNAAGVGFNDPTPRAPVGGNPGTTLGAQRLFIFQTAANIWGGLIPSSQVIRVQAQFAAQTCTATSAVLGSAGTTTIHRDFAGATFPGTWYSQALANRLTNADLSANPDINATFNLSIDSGCFGPGQVWYYGIDGLEGTNIELLPVVLHELGHGLGFQTFTSGTTGAYNSGFPTIYDRFLLDKISGLHWNQNSATQRVASAIALDKLVWDGPTADGLAASYLIGEARVLVNSPGGIAGTYMVGQDATFGAALTTPGVSGNVVLADDGIAPNSDACTPLINGGALAGNFAILDRGVCGFIVKCKAAQDAGAVGVIVVNNVAAGLPGMGGADPTITIPCIGISLADGNLLKANLGAGVNVTIGRDNAAKAGADNLARIKMYTPNPFVSGSSVSHWDVSLTPNALMEPAINSNLHDTVDLTLGQMRDIGWFPAEIASPNVATVICPTNSCVTMPVNLTRDTTTPVLGFSVTFQLGGGLSLCAGTSSITEGTFLSAAGGTTFQIIDNGGGSYTADGVVLAFGCGPAALTGNLFNVAVTSAAAGGTGTLTVTSVQLRDCNNNSLQAVAGLPGTVPIDNTAPVVTVTSPNGGEGWVQGSSQNITWTATDNVAVANVDLEYSTDGGATYPNVIATAVSNTGTYPWVVPNTVTNQARVRVTAHDTGCSAGSDASDADFSILNPPVTITASAGAGGTISPSGAVLVPYGGSQTFTIAGDACHIIADVLVDGVSVGAVASYTFTNAIVDHTIDASFAPLVVPVAAPTALTAAQVKTGNDGDGTTKTTITYSAPGAAAVEVWRAGFGSYPTYDNGGGAVPAVPGSYPPAGWTLTGVTASGQTDETTSRDYWYYIAFAKDACGNVSPASARTNGNLGYHLGDVSDGLTPGQGDNKVTTADISLLGAHYGLSGGALAGFEYLDVGPTTTTTTDGRPTTDSKTNFEDLVMFAINFNPVVSLATKGGAVAASIGTDLVSVGAADAVLAGEIIEIPVQLIGGGSLQAVSVVLKWDSKVVEPVGMTAGDLLGAQGGVVMSPEAGTVDAALLGVTGRGITGEGVLATVRFRALTAGAPSITVDKVIGRSSTNGSVAVKVGTPIALAKIATRTELQAVVPNPSRGNSVLGFSLAKEAHVELAIYSVDGRRVKSIVNGTQASGNYRFAWNGTDEQGVALKSGVYFVRFEAAGVKSNKIISLVR